MTNMAAIFSAKNFTRILSGGVLPTLQNIKLISHSAILAGGQRWRVRNGLAGDGLAYGPLTDLPDWSFADGKASPESKRRRKRQNRRQNELKRIMQYLKDIDKN